MDGRAGGRTDGRTNDKKALCFSVVSHPTGAQVPIFIAKMKSTSKPYAKSIVFFTFQITRTHNYRFLLFKNQFFCTAGDPADPADLLGSSRIFSDFPETRHEAWCTTPGTLAPEVRMTVVLNKLPQIINSGWFARGSIPLLFVGLHLLWQEPKTS